VNFASWLPIQRSKKKQSKSNSGKNHHSPAEMAVGQERLNERPVTKSKHE
jgi:hypothetical protein